MTAVTDLDLTGEEFACLAMRECGTRNWHFGHDHAAGCRFCRGILHSARELREAGLEIAPDGSLVPRSSS